MGIHKRLWEQLPERDRERMLREVTPCGTGHCRCGGRWVGDRWFPCNSPIFRGPGASGDGYYDGLKDAI